MYCYFMNDQVHIQIQIINEHCIFVYDQKNRYVKITQHYYFVLHNFHL